MEEKQVYQDSHSFSDRQVTWFVILSGIYRLLGKRIAKSIHFFVKRSMEKWEDSRLRSIYKTIRKC